jgi:predicted RNA-binding Zn-ribbon protein involved in translation (DUF1610 family)
MPICPSCGKNINSLKVNERLWNSFENIYEETYLLEEFICPKCGALLFVDQDKATEFLKK